MVIRVLLFGPYAAAVGAGHVDLDLRENATGGEALAALGAAHPALAPLLGSARLAINQSFAPPGAVVARSDELAVIGMVSGG